MLSTVPTVPSGRLKLLVVAPTCDGDDVGEAWVAFQWVRRLAERHDVTLLTYSKRGKRPASEQLPHCRVIEWIEPRMVGRAERFNSLLKPGYLPFYVRARRWIRAAHAAGERFDIAHQITPVAMRYPSPLTGHGIPSVIGPVGGSLPTPTAFASEDTSPWYVGLRRFDAWRLRHDRLLARTYDDAACVLGIAPYVGDLLRDRRLRRFEVISETAIESLAPEVDRAEHGDAEVRLLHVGRLVRSKGLRDVLSAMALTDSSVRLTLDVAGDGPDRQACEQLSADLGLADRVRFHGRLARSDVDALYRAADIFVFPSFREAGGNVAFEAMGWGLPLIVSDIGGPGAAVDDACGIRVHPERPEQYARDIAAAIDRLARDAALRVRMGEAARSRVSEIGLWESKIDEVDALYRDLVDVPRSGRAEVDVAVVVVTHNSVAVIGDLLDSLPAALGDLVADIVVVDNGSTDETCAGVAARGDCRLVRSTNTGYAAGINSGVANARPADAILVLNPDVRLAPRSVERMYAALSRPGVGVVAPQIRNPDGRLARSLRREPTLLRALGLTRTGVPALSEYVGHDRDYVLGGLVDWALGAVLLVSSECHDALGGWDESFFLYSEETDFASRAREQGFRTWYEPSALAVHIGAQSGTSDRIHSMQILNRVRYYRRRHDPVRSSAYYVLAIGNEVSRFGSGDEHRHAVRALLQPDCRPEELRCNHSRVPA